MMKGSFLSKHRGYKYRQSLRDVAENILTDECIAHQEAVTQLRHALPFSDLANGHA